VQVAMFGDEDRLWFAFRYGTVAGWAATADQLQAETPYRQAMDAVFVWLWQEKPWRFPSPAPTGLAQAGAMTPDALSTAPHAPNPRAPGGSPPCP
jgi:hypothetical protein